MKTIQTFIIVICAVFSLPGTSQTPFPAAFDIVSDTFGTITLPARQWQYVEDRANRWTIDSIRQPLIEAKFRGNTAAKSGNMDPMYNYWLRFRLKNTMQREAQIVLEFSRAWQSDIYIFDPAQKEHHFRSGRIPWSKRDGYTTKNLAQSYLPVSIPAGDEWVVYMKNFTKNGPGTMPSGLLIRLLDLDKMRSELNLSEDINYIQMIKDSLFFGILLWVAIFNLAFFSIVKERVYLYFALYVFSLGITRFVTPLYHLFFREHPTILISLHYFFVPCIILFTTYFFRNLFKIHLYYPVLDKLLLILSAISLMCYWTNLFFIHYLVPPKWVSIFNTFNSLTAAVVYLLLLATLISFVRMPEKLYKNMAFTLLPPFGTWVVLWSSGPVINVLVRWFGITPPFSYLNWLKEHWHDIEIICLIWMVVYFSWVLLERFNVLRRQVVQKELEKEIERNQLMAQQKEELEIQVEERTHKLQESLDILQSTQTQLIQSEKLASLGELTAGIAHEIQNPLNFVNNFAEVSAEMLGEMEEELDKGDTQEAKAIAADLKTNLSKINHHGKRASSIVKGMLEHSRPSTGVKTPTDLNALADEYLRLAYHGLRAKDNNFNATLETHFDPDLPKVAVVSQDIGRVLLNLINNAFYAVDEKQKQQAQVESGTPLSESFRLSESYIPTISLRTKRLDNAVEISIKDNGPGIPESIKDKIFQPFFTTKPTGQGTGLGLSLAYDIVTKGHGGSIKLASSPSEGSEFIVQLPL